MGPTCTGPACAAQGRILPPPFALGSNSIHLAPCCEGDLRDGP